MSAAVSGRRAAGTTGRIRQPPRRPYGDALACDLDARRSGARFCTLGALCDRQLFPGAGRAPDSPARSPPDSDQLHRILAGEPSEGAFNLTRDGRFQK